MERVKDNARNDGRTSTGTKREQPRRRKEIPQLPEKTRKLTLKAFQKTYEAHHNKSS